MAQTLQDQGGREGWVRHWQGGTEQHDEHTGLRLDVLRGESLEIKPMKTKIVVEFVSVISLGEVCMWGSCTPDLVARGVSHLV